MVSGIPHTARAKLSLPGIEEMDLSMYLCRKADPESKGKVENSIKYVKRNFLAIRDSTNPEDADVYLIV